MGRNREVFSFDARADTAELDKMKRGLDDFADSITDMGKSADQAGKDADKGGNGIGSFADATIIAGGAIGAFQAGLGLLQGVFSATVGGMFEQEQAMRRVGAATGLTGDALADFETQAEDVFLNNWGDDFNDVVNTMTQVKQITGESGDALEDLTTNAFIMRDAFDKDITESVRSANTMMENFGISNDEAFDILARGIQLTGDPADDLLDTFNEYSGNLADMGFSAQEAMDLLIDSMQAGATNTDFAADALREFNIRLLDGTSSDAIKSLSDDTNAMFEAFQNGDATAADVFNQMQIDLQQMDDDVLRNQLGVQIYGTKWEDMGADAILAMDTVESSLGDVEGATDRAGAALSSGIGPAFDSLKRAASQALIDGLEPYAPVIEDKIIPAIQQFTVVLVNKIIPGITSFIEALAPAVGNLMAFGGSIIAAFGGKDAIFTALSNGFDKVISFTTWLSEIDIAGGLAVWAEIPGMFGDLANALITKFGEMATAGADFVAALIPSPEDIATAFAEMDFTAVAEALAGFGDLLATSLPDWSVWAYEEIIQPIVDGMAGLYNAIATAVNNAIPPSINLGTVTVRRPPGLGLLGVPDPLFEGVIDIPIPNHDPMPLMDLGDNATGGQFTVPFGGDAIPGSTDRKFAIGLTPGEQVDITPRNQANMGGGNRPQVIQLMMPNGKVLLEQVVDENGRSGVPGLAMG